LAFLALQSAISMYANILSSIIYFFPSFLMTPFHPHRAISIPLKAYSTFVVEERHGFNKTTFRTFVLDTFKGIALGVVLGGPFMAALVWIVRWAGASFVQFTLLFVLAFQLVRIPP
jgi:STE24 endopeptidase